MVKEESVIYRVTNCPIPNNVQNHHEGVDLLLNVLGNNGLKLYKVKEELALGGPEGLVDKDDVVLLNINAQWKYRGCTNSDVIRGLIQRILEHPYGFTGEIVLLENGQGKGSFDCDVITGGQYPDTKTHANAEDKSHSFSYLVGTVFADPRVSMYLLDPIRETFISEEDHATDGYRKIDKVSYPCFTTTKGNRVELREGVWNGKNYDANLKLINVPVLKHHGGCGITGALKSYYGILSMSDGKYQERHYDELGEHCGKMITKVRAPDLSILDCIWVSPGKLGIMGALSGYPVENTIRLDQLLASTDPVALDYWASKYILYPIDNNKEHHPDLFDPLHKDITQAQDVINSNNGIRGHRVTFNESTIKIITQSFL